MKKLLASVTLLASVAAFGAIDDTTVIVGSKGPDKYADGTQAVVGECYALVWSQDDFGGFNADGSLVNAADEVLVILSRADANGACPLFGYDVPRAMMAKGGRLSLWLLDTRSYGAAGETNAYTVAGWATKSVPAVASAAKVDAEITLSAPGVKTISGAAAGTAVATAAPDAPKPVVRSFKIENGYAILEVENTVPYLAYDVSAGETPDALQGGQAAHPVSGAATKTETITLIKKVEGDKGFYRVDRK